MNRVGLMSGRFIHDHMTIRDQIKGSRVHKEKSAGVGTVGLTFPRFHLCDSNKKFRLHSNFPLNSTHQIIFVNAQQQFACRHAERIAEDLATGFATFEDGRELADRSAFANRTERSDATYVKLTILSIALNCPLHGCRSPWNFNFQRTDLWRCAKRNFPRFQMKSLIAIRI